MRQKEEFTIETNKWCLHVHAVVIPPVSIHHHGHAVLDRPRVVRLTFLPLPVAHVHIHPCVEAFTLQRPPPAADVVVQADPEGNVQVFGQFVYSADVPLVGHGAQVSVFGPTVALRLRPIQLQLGEQDVLMDVGRGACWGINT